MASFLHPCPPSLPRAVNFQCKSFWLFSKCMALNFALLNPSSWGRAPLSGMCSAPFLYWWQIPMFITTEFRQHIPAFMPSSLVRILIDRSKDWFLLPCLLLQQASSFLFKTTLCFISFKQSSTLRNSCTKFPSFLFVDNFLQYVSEILKTFCVFLPRKSVSFLQKTIRLVWHNLWRNVWCVLTRFPSTRF